MRIALFQPDIPQNCGTILRLAACFGVAVDIIEPCGFVFDDRRFRRAGMDYLESVELVRHNDWETFKESQKKQETAPRLVLATTKASDHHTDFEFQPNDLLVFGRESSGVPLEVAEYCDEAIKIPMAPGTRSINIALSAAIILGEALRQTNGFPKEDRK
jgi:tRNA (cytidine/uridine-2'-O-)-methyltransferase